jgi:hypothetical protein
MWSCPHCGAAQAESARCWVCRRSSTTCSTCRHFRTSLAADVGWCALDRRRRPLTGLELRGCWAERPTTRGEADARRGDLVAQAPTPRTLAPATRGFVPVDDVRAAGTVVASISGETMTPPAPPPGPDPADGWDRRFSLFGDLER